MPAQFATQSRGDWPGLGLHAGNAPAGRADAAHLHIFEQHGAGLPRTPGERGGGVCRVGLPVAGIEAAADQVVDMHERPEALQVLRRAELDLRAVSARARGRALQLLPPLGIAGRVDRAGLAKAGGLAGLGLQLRIETDRIGEDGGKRRMRSGRAHQAGGMPCGAAGELLAFEQQHALAPAAREVVGEAEADNAAADDDDGCMGGEGRHDGASLCANASRRKPNRANLASFVMEGFHSMDLPALSLTAVPGRRLATLELAREIERRGFAGMWVPSPFSGLGLCHALAHATERVTFATSIAPIYFRQAEEFAQAAAFIHEVSGGRFRFGIGVSHQPVHERMGLRPGKPLGDIRAFVEEIRGVPRTGGLPPVVLAAMRPRMIALAGEVAEGIVFANAARTHIPASLEALPAEKREDAAFEVACMTPTCVSDDLEAAKAVNRRTLTRYAQLPYYRSYWKDAGYREEMEAVERAMPEGDAAVAACLSDRWLGDVTLFGPPASIREGVEELRAAGVSTPVLVPSSAAGGQMKAFEEVMAAFG